MPGLMVRQTISFWFGGLKVDVQSWPMLNPRQLSALRLAARESGDLVRPYSLLIWLNRLFPENVFAVLGNSDKAAA